ncbi:MAG: SBBP repeat-containing protein, partial [Candidatus Brocadiae bacterium]|nr:SBBP repeat-containing protein [Candidatus Brocadiia bacterium]
MRELPAVHIAIVCSVAIAGLLTVGLEAEAAEGYALSFSTYLGGKGGEDTARAVAVDAKGNILVAGGTRSADFPTTPGAYSRTHDASGRSAGARGPMDVFVTKLDPEGRIVWSTFLGGPNYDRAYTVRVDRQGFVYVAGRAGEGFPTTPGTVQPEFAGDQRANRAYGKQDGFITKLSPDGSRVVWSTYFGTPGPAIIRDMDVDAQGAVYLVMIELSHPSAHITRGAFQERQPGGMDSLVAKVAPDGSRVVWCTYFGGSGRDLAPSLRVGSSGEPVVAGSTFSTDFPVTSGAFQRQRRGKQDAFVAKLAADGSRLLYATLLGGSKEDGAAGKHGLALDGAGRACVVGFTSSPDFPTTPNAFQRRYAGGMTGAWRQTGDRFVAIVSAAGSRLEAATLLGGNARDGGEGVEMDAAGRVYLG